MTTTTRQDAIPVDEIAKQIITSPDDIVFVSGSLVEGFGNENSDLDLFLVRAGGEVTPDPRLVLATVGLGETYIDYEVYNEANMAAVARLVNDTEVSDFRAVWQLPMSRLDLYYRTAIARPAYNEYGLRALQSQFNADVLAARLAAWTGLRCAHALSQADELLALGDGRHAVVSATNACGYAVDSYLASHGEAYPNLKWRFEKLARHFGRDSALYERAWDLKAPGYRPVPTYVEAVRTFCDEIGMDAYASWTADSLRLGQARDAHAFRVAGHHFVVQNKTLIYELSRTGRYLWDALDGAITRPELIRKFAHRFGLTHEPAHREVVTLLRSLRKFGLLRET